MTGPVGKESGQEAADGAGVVVEVLLVVDEGDGPSGGDLVALAGGLECGDGRQNGLIRLFGRVFGNQVIVARDTGADPAE